MQKVRPADLGRDLSRRSIEDGRKLLEAYDDRRAAAMLRSAHPGVAGNVLGSCDPTHSARILEFMPTEHQVAILGSMPTADRVRSRMRSTPKTGGMSTASCPTARPRSHGS